MNNPLKILHDAIAADVARFSDYTKEVKYLLSSLSGFDKQSVNKQILSQILNGATSLALKRLIPIEIRKRGGLFFTSNVLAERIADLLTPHLQRGSKVLDPACGAGNLLVACSRHIPIGQNLKQTLALWSKLIYGYDFHIEFIRTTRLRLILLALSLHPDEIENACNLEPDQIFTGLKVKDALTQERLDPDTCIVINPPFGYIEAPAGCAWAKGKIQVAALFLERFLQYASEGQHVAAILPDVLRSGTRYRKWRTNISSLCRSIDIELAGRFDKDTDVDVFILHAMAANRNSICRQWPMRCSPVDDYTVSDFFDVHVGPVVPHRDPIMGPRLPYIHVRTMPAWQTIEVILEYRRYVGTVYRPPFLVIRRTSSPGDKHRCVATIVNTQSPVAVENHLLVLLPHDGSLQSCEQLLMILKSPQTDEWLNIRTRCRHLTVSAIRELPCCLIRQHY
jgi:hypothetical protein